MRWRENLVLGRCSCRTVLGDGSKLITVTITIVRSDAGFPAYFLCRIAVRECFLTSGYTEHCLQHRYSDSILPYARSYRMLSSASSTVLLFHPSIYPIIQNTVYSLSTYRRCDSSLPYVQSYRTLSTACPSTLVVIPAFHMSNHTEHCLQLVHLPSL